MISLARNTTCALSDLSIDDAVAKLLFVVVVRRFDPFGEHESERASSGGSPRPSSRHGGVFLAVVLDARFVAAKLLLVRNRCDRFVVTVRKRSRDGSGAKKDPPPLSLFEASDR